MTLTGRATAEQWVRNEQHHRTTPRNTEDERQRQLTKRVFGTEEKLEKKFGSATIDWHKIDEKKQLIAARKPFLQFRINRVIFTGQSRQAEAN